MQAEGRTILVTGATGGIGSLLCRELAGRGARLVMNCTSREKLAKLQAELGGGHVAAAADISTSEGRQAIVAACVDAGGIDGLINLAGILDFGMFQNQEASLIARIIDVNTRAPVLLTHQLLPMLLERPAARILNVGSIFGSIGHPGFTVYCASKAAIKTFSEALSRELADTNVAVAYIAPRATRTALNSDRVTALNAELGNKTDTPEHVAASIADMFEADSQRRFLGWPEKLFVHVNALLPTVVHKALVKNLPIIKKHAL
jgi:short-subunit dehydrogenase